MEIKGHSQEKSFWNKHRGLTYASTKTADVSEIFWLSLKNYDFWKIHLLCINQNLFTATTEKCSFAHFFKPSLIWPLRSPHRIYTGFRGQRSEKMLEGANLLTESIIFCPFFAQARHYNKERLGKNAPKRHDRLANHIWQYSWGYTQTLKG
jgi:hypothetical protein